MKKNIDEQTKKLFEAARTAFIENYSTGVIKSPIAKNVAAAEIGRFFAWLVEDKKLKEMIPHCYTYEKSEYQRRRRAIANNIKKCGFSVNLQDDSKVIVLIDGYQCGIMALPRIYSELCRLVGEKPVELAAWPINESAQPATADDATGQPAAPVVDAPAADDTPVAEAAPAEARKFRLYYINHSDKAVSRVVELIKADVEGSPLPVWIECREDDYGRKYGRTCYQLTDSICFRANAGYISEEYISPLTGGEISDWHKEHIDMFNNNMANIKAEIIATPAAQLNGTKWPNLAVVNAYTAAGMATEAAYLMDARERITKEREERRKTQEEEARRHEEERRRQEAEEKARRIAEATKKFVEKGEITGEDVVMLCDEEGIRINPRTRHNLLEVVTYFENDGNRANYKTYSKRKPSLDGCFTVAESLYQLLKIKADEAENASPTAPDFSEVLAADAAAMPLALPAINESAIIEQAARIKAAHEALKAEAEREQAAAAFAEAITAYCEELSRPEPLVWEPETIIIPFEPRPAAEVEQPRRRHRMNPRPRLSRWLHPARWIAAVFVVCLLSVLLLGMNTSTAADADAAADHIAAVYDLSPVTVTAAAVTDAPAAADTVTPSNQKTASDIAAVTDAPAADAVAPSNQKTASDIAAVTDAPAAAAADGLTICAGTAWAYTMMNWA